MKYSKDLKITGRYTIKFIDSITKKETREPIEKVNFLHERFYSSLARHHINDGSLSFSSFYIWRVNIPGYTYPNTTFNYNISINSNPSLMRSILPEGFERSTCFGRIEDEPLYSQTYSRFPSTGAESTFNVLMISDHSSSSICYVISSIILDPPITQGAYEDLDIYYNLEVPIIGIFNKSKSASLALTSNININDSFNIRNISPRYCALPTTIQEDPINGYEYINVSRNYIIGHNGKYGSTIGAKTLTWESDPTNFDLFNTAYGMVFNTVFLGVFGDQDQKLNHDSTTQPKIMNILGSNAEKGHSQGNGSTYDWFKYTDTLTEPFQSRFMKRAGAERPFWEATENATTRGDIKVEGTWQPETRFPEVYRIQITNGGSVGTATYQVWIRKFITIACQYGGSNDFNYRTKNYSTYNGNSWENDLYTPLPFIHGGIKHKRHRGSSSGYPKFPCPWNKEEIVMWDRKGFTVLNLYDGHFRTWDKDSIPVLPVTKLKQISFDDSNRKIYAACKETGLYVINYDTSTVTKLVNEPCHAVDIGFNSKVFAIFNGRMSNSDNWSTPLPLLLRGVNGSNLPYNSASIPNSWSNIFYIKINRDSTTYDMAIVTTSGLDPARFNNYRLTADSNIISWWNINNSSSVECTNIYFRYGAGSSGNPLYLIYWPAGDIWVNGYYYFRFNSTSTTRLDVYTRRTDFNIIDDIEGTPYITNKALDNWDWFDVNDEPGFLASTNSYLGNPIIWKGYLVTNTSIFTHIDSSNNLVHLNSSKSTIDTDWIFEFILLDDDLGLNTVDHWTSVSFSNLFYTQYDSRYYDILNYGWAKYGWDGSNWVEDHPASRVTHTSLQKGPHNLDISFSNGTGSTPVFETGQYLLQYMANGFLMDNTTSYQLFYNLYIAPVNRNVNFPSGFTVSGTSITEGIKIEFPHGPLGITPDPLYLAPISGSKLELDININGVKAPLFYDDEKGTPAPGEVVFHRHNDNMSTNIPPYLHLYYLIFNPSDNGKSITGSYGYVKYPSL